MEVSEKQRNTQTDLLHIYRELFPVCARWVRSQHGTPEDAQDLFQDALIIYLEKTGKEASMIVSAEAYIIGITKHLWIRKFHKSLSSVSLTAFEQTLSIPVDFNPAVNTMKLLRFLEIAGRNCLELLTRFYYEKRSMKDLSASMGYGSERSATVQKYKCIEKLRNSIKQRTLSYEDFTE